ncbi:MAG: MFS transporter [Pseudomonadota bacterium]
MMRQRPRRWAEGDAVLSSSAAPKAATLAILPLALAETLAWSAYYYSFPAFLPAWEADLGWGRAQIAGAFTACLILTGLLAPYAGRLIDRGYARLAFLGAVIAGALLLVALSFVQTLWQFWAVWLALGLVNAACLYEACFAIITVVTGARAKQFITVVTLVAGFAGTISFPSAFALSEALGWRDACLVFAGVMICVALPLAGLGFRWLEGHREDPADAPVATGQEGRTALQNPVFWYIAIGFSTIGIVHGMTISHIRPILDDREVAVGLAVLVASLFGPMQVLGRLIMIAIGDRLSTMGLTLVLFLGIAVGLTVLFAARLEPMLVLVFVVPYGAAYGIASIVRPVITAEYLGRAGFGMIAGMLAMPYMLGFAIGPTLAALIWGVAGYDVVIVLATLLVLCGCGLILLARRAARRGTP